MRVSSVVLYARGNEVRSTRADRVVASLASGTIRDFAPHVEGYSIATNDGRVVVVAGGAEREVVRGAASVGLPYFAVVEGNATRIFDIRRSPSPAAIAVLYDEVPVRFAGAYLLTSRGHWIDLLRSERIEVSEPGTVTLPIATRYGIAYVAELADGTRYVRELVTGAPPVLLTRALLTTPVAALGHSESIGLHWLAGNDVVVPSTSTGRR